MIAPLVVAIAAQVGAAVPAIVSRATVDPARPVDFHAMVEPDTVFLGEQATYQIAVFLDDEVRARMRRNPEFVPPELRSLVAFDLPAGIGRLYQRTVGGKRYEVHVYERALFGLVPGRVEIPSAELLYSLPLNASFFSREESHALRSERLALVVREPPAAGRPPDYLGAVGSLRLDTRLDARQGRVGDPFVLTVGVTGEANVGDLPRPAISLSWGTAVPASERVRLDSTSLRVRGRKEFDWILTPRDTGILAVPPVKYWFFNPVTEKYELAVVTPESLAVQGATLASADTAAPVPPLSLRREFRGERPPPLPGRRWVWMLAIAVPIPAGIAALRGAWRLRRARPRSATATLRSLSRSADADTARIRRAWVAALAERLLLPAESLTRRGELARQLRRSGVVADTAREADALLRELDEAIYAGERRSAPRGAARRAFDLLRRVDREAIRRVSLLILAAASIAAARPAIAAVAQAVALRARFLEAVGSYAMGDYAQASVGFAAVARSAPRAPDAWANLGTASWAAGDTATAAVGWQRALRLEPSAPDVRERLDLLGIPARGIISYVPPVSSDFLVMVALASWGALWGVRLLGALARPAPRWMLPATLATVIVGAAAAGGAREIEEGRDLAVVVAGGPLRALPALGADRGAPTLTGEVARTRTRQGVWTRVQLDGGRSGWIESQRLVELGG